MRPTRSGAACLGTTVPRLSCRTVWRKPGFKLEQQADDNVEDSEIFKMTYDQTEATLVSNAQTNMISYHQKARDLDLKKKNRELLAATMTPWCLR